MDNEKIPKITVTKITGKKRKRTREEEENKERDDTSKENRAPKTPPRKKRRLKCPSAPTRILEKLNFDDEVHEAEIQILCNRFRRNSASFNLDGEMLLLDSGEEAPPPPPLSL